MPASYLIVSADRLVVSRGSGDLTDDELLAHARALAADPRFEPTFRQFADLRDVKVTKLTAEGILRLAKHNPFAPEARRAVLVSNDVQFGLARMYEHRTQHAPETLRVFRDPEEAVAWLGLPPEWSPPPDQADWSSAAAAAPPGSGRRG